MKSKKVRTISSVILRSNTNLLLFATIFFATVSLLFVYISASRLMHNSMQKESLEVSKRIEWVVKSYKNIVESMGIIPELSNPDIPVEEKQKILDARSEEFGLIRSLLINKNGLSEADNNYRGDRYYFKEALKGNIVINDPVIGRSDGNISICLGGPVWEKGIYGGNIDSVLFISIQPEILNDIVKEIKITRHSTARIIGPSGYTVASPIPEQVSENVNFMSLQKPEKQYKHRGKIEEEAIFHGKQVIHHMHYGTMKAFVFQPIAETPGWILEIEAPFSDYLGSFYTAVFILILAAVGIIFFCRKKMESYAIQVSDPVVKMAERLRKAAVGDFSSEVNFEDTLDEVNIISSATQKLVNRMALVLDKSAESSENADLFSLLDFDEFLQIHSTFESEMNVRLCLYDKYQIRILGSEPLNPENGISENIYINKKIAGHFVITPDHNCILTSTEMRCIATSLAILIGKIMENILRREEKHIAQQQNQLVNVNNILANAESIAGRLTHFIVKNENGFTNNDKNELKEILEQINESTEFARFSRLNPKIHENDYRVNMLIEKISSGTDLDASIKERVTVKPNPDLPEKLFGDMDSIDRAVSRIIICLGNANPVSEISLILNHVLVGMGSELQITVQVSNPVITENEFERFKLLALKTEHNDRLLTTFEQKILSAFKLIYTMNGSILIDSFQEELISITLKIPQLLAVIAD